MITPAEFYDSLKGSDKARNIAWMWTRFNNQRRGKIEEWKELRNYLFATDTTTTTNSALPWKNSTTRPKLTQLRDNLHANYISALFPNENWFKWEGNSFDDATITKSRTIESYMASKTRQANFKRESGKLVLDFIDYGNAFATVIAENRVKELPDGSTTTEYVGPRLVRISPMDIVFDAVSNSFDDSFKIIRSIKSIGELYAMAEDEPENAFLHQALANRDMIQKNLGLYSIEDQDKSEGIQIDGFGNLTEYYQSGTVEVLEFWGDIHDAANNTFHRNRVITVIDRAHVIRDEAINNFLGRAPFFHASWRQRPDNLWGMGPLDNLVGMQYRIDHLENLKADAMDFIVHPPLKIKGEVEEFTWAPGELIHIDEDGDVVEMALNMGNINLTNNEIQLLENEMEMFAGAPREAMGIRTAGEKTAFEVQQLQNAAGRIFQEKITLFERELIEPALNAMLDNSLRNMTESEVVGAVHDELAGMVFRTVTRDDLAANGLLRPMGARHFAQQAQLLSNLNMLYSGQLGASIAPHVSTIQLAKLVEDALGIEKYKLIIPFISVAEQKQAAALAGQAQEDLTVEQSTPAEGQG